MVVKFWRVDMTIERFVNEKAAVGTLNKNIYDALVTFALGRGYEVSRFLTEGLRTYYRFIFFSGGILHGGDDPINLELISIEEFFKLPKAAPEISVGDYKVTKTPDGIRFGCTEIPLGLVEEIYRMAKGER